jgi:glycolate oxidase FAD binding subunit
MTSISTTLEGSFRAILGAHQIHNATPTDSIYGVQSQLVLEPTTEQQLAATLRLANEAGLAVILRGGGTKLGWGNPPSRADVIFSTARLNKILEHAWADLTVTAEAGCTIQTLQETLAQHGQRLALDPLRADKATVGGILSTNDSGALRFRFGALRDLIIGVTIALPDGTLASSGGKVVKNVAGYDLPKLITGALGTLGVITRAVFRLHPLPHHTGSFSISVANPDEAQRLVLGIQDSKLAHVALQSSFSADAPPSVDILFEGTAAGVDAQASQLRSLCPFAQLAEAAPAVWNVRQDLWSFSSLEETAIAKVGTLPTDLARTIELFRRAADSTHLRWQSLMYATGLSWLRLEGRPDNLHCALTALRADLEKMGGSLVLLHRPTAFPPFDAWGTPGDSLPLMKSVKRQLDPANTLNPGRFLGGI